MKVISRMAIARLEPTLLRHTRHTILVDVIFSIYVKKILT